MYLGIIIEGCLEFATPAMLIKRKANKDKRVLTDFRHLNIRIAKNNFANHFLKDTFLMIGSSRC